MLTAPYFINQLILIKERQLTWYPTKILVGTSLEPKRTPVSNKVVDGAIGCTEKITLLFLEIGIKTDEKDLKI